jgi:tricorn protease
MNRILSILLCIFCIFDGSSQNNKIYFSSSPCISPDGKTIVFTYEGDLWQVAAQGGMAMRLTAMEGDESRAKFSPDGKWIAFTGSQYGNQDVYIMSSKGGDVRQLTYHEASDQVDSWSWDSQKIYFTSSRFNRFSGYTIAVTGGTPIRLYDHYFHTVHNLAEHPNGEIFFSETSESKNQSYRKGYKGPYNPDIQSYNPSTGVFKKYTSYQGKDMWPTIDRAGNIYFVSDEKNGQYNLCTFDKGKPKYLTAFNTSIRNPMVSADGQSVVFEKDFQIYLYNVKSGDTRNVLIEANTLLTSGQDKDFDVKGKITYFDVSEDGKKLSFVSRGELFVSDIKGKFVKQILTNPSGRVTEVKWMADNKSLLFAQTTENGYTNIFSIRADSIEPEKQWTKENQNNRELSLNKDRTKAVFLSGRNDVDIIDLKNKSVKTVVKDELWGFQNSTPSFSSNGEYVLFTAKRNFEEDIFVYHIENEKLINLTNTGITENSPVWSPDGRYIYFTSNRFRPAYPFGLSDGRVYRLPLEKFNSEFKSDKYVKLFEDKSKEKKTDSLSNIIKKDSLSNNVNDKYTIDLTDILNRIELVSPDFGTQGDVFVTQKDDLTMAIYPSNHSENEYNLWMTTYSPFEKTKTEKIEGAKTFGTFIVKSSDKYYALLSGNINILNLESKKSEKIDISYIFRRNLKSEFSQMFTETWANVNENFYNETFHGLDWQKKRDEYSVFVPYIRSRSDLRVLITDMLGELNSSHTGFTSLGDEEKTFYSVSTLGTGIVWENKDPYKVSRIVAFSPADKRDIDLRSGDKLIAVNGVTLDMAQNREYYFAKPSLDTETDLTFQRKDSVINVKIHPESYSTIKNLLYDEWIAGNQERVDTKSNKKIAYAHMKDMGQSELNKFLIEMTTEAYNRDGLILDIRYNNGGNVHDNVLQFLSQKPYLKWKYREGALTIQPNFTPAGKPIILLTNEQSLSDAEMTTEGFKRLGLGKIVGTETYKWIIFTSGKALVDGSFYRLPAWGCYTLDGKNLEKEGVSPDIRVDMDFKDRLEKRDPQLDRAIAEILNQLK